MTQDLFLITINKINIYISQLINLSSPVNNAVPSESHGIVLQLCIWRSESSFHPCKRKINSFLIRFLASLQTLSQSDPINPFVCGLSKNIHILTECWGFEEQRRMFLMFLNVPNYSDLFKRENLAKLIEFCKQSEIYNLI